MNVADRIGGRIRRTYISQKPLESGTWATVEAALLLVLASVAVWAEVAGADHWLPANRESVFARGELWRLLTTIFVHGDLKHLLSNMLLFTVLGYLVRSYYGLSAFPILAFLLGALANALTLWLYEPGTTLVGASGVVYALAGFWLTLYLFIERRHSIAGRVLRALGFALVMLVPETFDPKTSYLAHAFGFGLGSVAAIPYFVFNRNRYRAAEQVVFDSESDSESGEQIQEILASERDGS